MLPGIRVLRRPVVNKHLSPDLFLVGTLVKEKSSGKFVVFWDLENETLTPVDGAMDILVYDTAPAGIYHEAKCLVCSRQIYGVRYKCAFASCTVNVCGPCYMSEADYANDHDASHCFFRLDFPFSLQNVLLPERRSSIKASACGLGKNATVKRGPHWDWGAQDGNGGVGCLLSCCEDWEEESVRSICIVKWCGSKTVNHYRLGHRGYLDIVATESAVIGPIFPSHLPYFEGDVLKAMKTLLAPPAVFLAGDLVRICVNGEVLQRVQCSGDYGGWSVNMEKCLNECGYVVRTGIRGGIRVQFHTAFGRWTFSPRVLIKVYTAENSSAAALQQPSFAYSNFPVYKIGDCVKLVDAAAMEQLQSTAHNNMSTITELADHCAIVRLFHRSREVTIELIETENNDTLNNNNINGISVATVNIDCILRHALREEIASAGTELAQQVLSGMVPSTSTEQPLSMNVQTLSLEHCDRPQQNTSGCSSALVDVASSPKSLKTSLPASAMRCAHDVGASAVSGRSLNASFYESQEPNNAANVVAITTRMQQQEPNQELINDLIAAVEDNDVEAVRKMSLADPKLFLKLSSDQNTAMNVAAFYGDIEMLQLCFSCDNWPMQLELQDAWGNTPLHSAILSASVEVLDLLASRCANLSIRNCDGFQPLHLATMSGNLNIVRKILALLFTDVNAQDNAQRTSLHIAIEKSFSEIVTELLSHQADTTVENGNGLTPIFTAVQHWNESVFLVLINAAPNCLSHHSRLGFPLFHFACAANSVDACRFMLRNKLFPAKIVDAAMDHGWTPLHVAVRDSAATVVELLVKQRANDVGTVVSNFLDDKRRTSTPSKKRPKFHGILGGLDGALGVLRCNLSPADEIGNTPLEYAAELAVKFVRDNGFAMYDVLQDIKDKAIATMSTLVELSGSAEIAILLYLLMYNADVDIKNKDDRRPMEHLNGLQSLVNLCQHFHRLRDQISQDDDVEGNAALCVTCDVSFSSVLFRPCGHRVFCANCCTKAAVKKCPRCLVPITEEIDVRTGQPMLPSALNANASYSELRKLKELEQSVTCQICMTSRIKVLFSCGHHSCNDCFAKLIQCHVCRKIIDRLAIRPIFL